MLGVRVGEREIGGLADSPVALMTLRVAQDVAGMRGRVSRIFLQAHAGREAAAREQATALAGTVADVRPGDWDVDVAEIPLWSDGSRRGERAVPRRAPGGREGGD